MATRKTKEEKEAEKLAIENSKELLKEADLLTKFREEGNVELVKATGNLEKQLEILKKISEYEKQELFLREKINENLKKHDQNHKEIKKLTEIQDKAIKSINGIIGDTNKRLEETKESYKKITQEVEHQENILKRQKQLNKDIGDALQNQIQQLFGIDGSASTIAGKFLKSKLEIIDMQKGLKEASFSTKVLVSAVDSLVQNTIELAKEQETVFTELNKNIGAYGQYESIIIDVNKANVQFGISTKDAAVATEALFKNINTFNALSKDTTKDLIDTTSKLEKFGISSEDTAKNIMTLTKATGMSLDAARKLQIQFAVLADDIGLPPKQLAEEFSSAAPKLAMYGADMTKVFVGLAKASKETGLSINSLIGITSKFNTFEGAADAAGKLNAILGGDLLNSTELMLASDEDRAKMVQESLVLSGKNWESLNRFEKMAIASAAGIQDMDEATRFFNPSQNKMTVGLRDAQEAAKKLEERAQDVQEVSQRWDNVMKSLSLTMRPFIGVIEGLVGAFAWLIDELNKLGGANTAAIIFSVGILIASLIKVGSVLTSLIKIKEAFSAASGFSSKMIALFGKEAEKSGENTGKGSARMADGIRSIGRAATESAKGLFALGFLIISVGTSIGLAAYGVSNMVGAFAKLNGDQIWGAIGAIAALGVAIAGIVAALSLLASSTFITTIGLGILVGVAAAMLAIGYSIKLAAEGIGNAISKVIQANTNLISAMKELPTTFSTLESTLERLKDFDFSDLAKNMATPFTQTVQAIKEATGEMTKFKSEYASLAPSPTAPNTAAMSNAMSSTNQVVMYTKAVEVVKNQATAAANVAQPQDSKPVTLILKIDSREFAEATWQAYKDVTEIKMRAR